ncbi:MAG: M4 family metallopeptidase [Gammaproteobacteria bacterium]
MFIRNHQCHNPLHCILPPYLLKELAERGTLSQKERALQTLKKSAEFRAVRQQMGELIARPEARAAATGKQRTIYSADNEEKLPGRKIRGEGDPAIGDAAADEAYDGAGATYDLFHDIYERNSIDDQGMELISTVHYGKGYDNAFWNGEQMTYGDGDEDLPEAERLFKRFTIAVDIIGHEMTHGVTEHEAGLVYFGQYGALNESMSDVFGMLVKQRILNQTADQSDWILGAGLFTSNVNAQGIRSMKAPGTAYDDPKLGKDPQPDHMDNIYTGFDDNGGVHINSGIPNRAFYIAATEIGGYAWEKAGRIWYIALRDKLTSTSNFSAAAKITYEVAGELYGPGSAEQQAVAKGWNTVGLTVTGEGDGGGVPGGCMAAPFVVLSSYLFGNHLDI